MKFIITKYSSYESENILVRFDENSQNKISIIEINGDNSTLNNGLNINNQCTIKKGYLSEFKDIFYNTINDLKTENNENHRFLFKYLNDPNIKFSYKQTYLDLFLILKLSNLIDENTLNLNDSISFLKKKNTLNIYVLTNLIPLEIKDEFNSFIYFYNSLFKLENSNNLIPYFYSLCSNLPNQTNELLKKSGNDFMTLSLAFAFVNDMYPNSIINSKKLIDGLKNDKISIYLSRIKPLTLNQNESINLFLENNRLDIPSFTLWCKENEFKQLLNPDGIDKFLKRAIGDKFIISKDNNYFFTLEGRALATYIDSRMFSKLMK